VELKGGDIMKNRLKTCGSTTRVDIRTAATLYKWMLEHGETPKSYGELFRESIELLRTLIVKNGSKDIETAKDAIEILKYSPMGNPLQRAINRKSLQEQLISEELNTDGLIEASREVVYATDLSQTEKKILFDLADRRNREQKQLKDQMKGNAHEV